MGRTQNILACHDSRTRSELPKSNPYAGLFEVCLPTFSKGSMIEARNRQATGTIADRMVSRQLSTGNSTFLDETADHVVREDGVQDSID